jgi:catechol 2,3-dioxygenase-like lactoylglutathione lyase family enzyme
MPKLDRILETALYVDDLDVADAFYAETMGLERVLATPTFHAFKVGRQTILLLFLRGASRSTQTLPGGTIPPHDGSGPSHLCFGIASSELAAWRSALGSNAVAIEGEVLWPGGAESIYFRDPDGHMLELMTPGLWPLG